LANARVTTPDHASLDITGDLDVRVGVILRNAATAQWEAFLAKGNTSGDPANSSYSFSKNGVTATVSRFKWVDAGQTIHTQDSDASLISASRFFYRATLDVDDGASGHVVTFYYSDQDRDTNPNAVTWTQHSQHVIAGTTSIQASTALLWLGDIDTQGDLLDGRLMWVEIRAGIGGSIVADPDFRDRDQMTTATTLTDTTGKVFTFNSPAWWVLPLQRSIATGVVVAVGQATEVDSATVMGRAKSKALAQAVEADTGTVVTPLRSKLIGQATETDTAGVVTPTLGTPIARDYRQSMEIIYVADPIARDYRQSMEIIYVADPIGRVYRQSMEIILAAGITGPVGQAVETDTAGVVTAAKAKTIGQAVETDTAGVVTPILARIVIVGQAVETDTAGVVTPTGGFEGSDGYDTITRSEGGSGPDTSTDGDRWATSTRAGRWALSLRTSIFATSTEDAPSALPLPVLQTVGVSAGIETDIAHSVTPIKSAGPKVIAVGQAVEVDSATVITRRKARQVLRAIEADTAAVVVPSIIGSYGDYDNNY
jgi:hypothetical protein